MRTVKPVRTAEAAAEADTERAEAAEDAAGAGADLETYEIFRVTCPDCGQPIALLSDEERLPEHALCASPWNPFGLTVCRGSGRAAQDASPLEGASELHEQDVAALLTLPAGLDWRTQPFSHANRQRATAVRRR